MKTLLSLAILLSATLFIQAQQVIEIKNYASCDLLVQTYSVVSGTCVYNGNYQDNYVNAGSSMIVGAPAGEEWIYAEITGIPFCSGGVGIAVGTPMNCISTCNWNTPSYVVQTNNGCNGCLTNVAVAWKDCTAIGGELRIGDY